MSSTTELEQLVGEKAQLTGILQSMVNEEKYLGQRLRIVEEKLAVQMLRERVKAKRAVLDQLKSKIKELENRLEKPQKKEPEVIAKSTPTISQQPRQPEQRYVQR